MAEPFLGEIRVFSFNTIPRGWQRCEGQHLPINANQALYSLLGTMYGGNGTTTFALPDLRGRVPIQADGSHAQGAAGGEAAHTLTVNELPAHSHTAMANSGTTGNVSTPVDNVWAGGGANLLYAASTDSTLNAAALATTGGNQPHQNLQPYQALSFCIALQGIYPSRP